MTAALHHATAKRATKLGVRAEVTDDGQVVMTFGEFHKTIAIPEAKAFLDLFAEAVEGDEGVEALDWDSVDGDEDEANGKSTRSIVPERYRKRYQPNGDTCGDDLASQMREAFLAEGEDGKPCVDRPKLEAFAVAHGLWNDGYARLNNGQVRMNVGNRLRAKIRKDPEFAVNWP